MKKVCLIGLILISCFNISRAQTNDSISSDKWKLSGDANFYFFSNEFILLPVLKADKKALHLEGRYNYEDYNTFSAWAGYNFVGGNKLEYTFTPMIGGVIGNSNGIAPGLEFTLAHKNFELYSESEYLFDVTNKEYNFFYIWSDLTYSPKDWLWVGISVQRTRLYKTELDVQRGLMAGVGFKQWEFTGYLYNLFFDEPFFLITLTYNHD